MEMNGIAYCGIDCANCELFRANDNRAAQERVAAKLGIPADKAVCDGCRISGCVLKPSCSTRKCVTDKGHSFCSDCDSFPCTRIMPLAEGAAVYPHNMKLYNLMRIRLLGPDGFLREASLNRKLYFTGTFAIGEGPRMKPETDA